jgi:hypothetical protein
MKIVNNIVVITLLLFNFSCQKEKIEVNEDRNNNLRANAPLYEIMARVAQNPTSQDNVLDNSSCFAVQLPVDVIVNGQQITVSTTSDYQIVQDAIDAFSGDDDIVNFIFPIIIQFQNFELLTINNVDELDEVLDDCEEDNDFNEIDCITINYPIVINTYDSNNQIVNTITIQNNIDLYDFFETIEDNIYVSISYPISIINSNGQNVVINSNGQLENAIENAIEECGNNSSNGITLESVITDGTWYVSYFFKNNIDVTADFNGYNLTFNANGTAEVTGNGNPINGTWEINSNSSERKLELEFEDNVLVRLEEKWKVVEYSATLVKLRLVGEGNGGNNYLYLSKN